MAATAGLGSAQRDDVVTICAISVLAAMVANVVHEGLGHATTALLSGTQSGVLTTVAWSSDFDSRLVAAGGTLANLAAALVFWIALRGAKGASVRLRYFLLMSLDFKRIGCGGRCWSSRGSLLTMARCWWWAAGWCGMWEWRGKMRGG